jgi:hypothetical protein
LGQTAPQLTSISRTSASSISAGSTVSYSFVITPGTTSTINFIYIALQDSSGHQIGITQSGQASGTDSVVSTTAWLNGNYTVALIQIQDTAGIRTQYGSDGTISYPFGGTGPTTGGPSFSSLGFALTGGTGSIVAPQLTSISRTSASSISAGSTVSYNFVITPGTTSTINFIYIGLQDSSGNQIGITQSGQASGTASVVSTTSWLNGNYTVSLIQIQDTAGIRTQYGSDGTISYPFGGTGPTTGAPSFSSLGFAVTGGIAPTIAPTISLQPANQTVTAGGSATFSITAAGTPTPTYQWNFNGSAIAGATSSSFSITSAQSSNAGSYTVVVSNSAGSVTSSIATLTVNSASNGASAPTITAQPVSTIVTVGFLAQFSVTASPFSGTNYQWYRNGSLIPGATSFLYTITSAALTDAGSYTVVVSDAAGSVTSAAATLTVNSASTGSPASGLPTITAQPVSTTTTVGFLAQFGVTATPFPGTNYQWYKNGTLIPGATSFLYTITSAALTDAGSYTVVVSDSAGSVTSAAATLTVNSAGGTIPVTFAPVIAVQPVSQAVAANASATFSVIATGTPTLTYQWSFNGSAIAGATASSYTVANAQSSNAGSYAVLVSNSVGSVTSSAATLTVNPVGTTIPATVAPVITTQPSGASLSAGQSVTLSVAATGATSYQWYLNGVAVSGATGSTLVISNVQAANSGAYTVVATNSAGSVTSSTAAIAIIVSAHLTNLSARAYVGTGGNQLIAGFVVGGTGPKNLLVRANGPSLGSFGITGFLTNPVLSLANVSGSVISSNTGWGNSSVGTTLVALFNQVGAFAWAANSADSALYTSLATGNYTALVSGLNNGTGVGLAEIYDADTGTPTARLTNISARANVGTGSNILIAGFVIAGAGSEKVLIRGIGPGLANYGLTGVLPTPQLALYTSTGALIATDVNGWGGSPLLGPAAGVATVTPQSASAAVMAGVGAFSLTAGSADAAMLVTLPSGNYTAQVVGGNSTTGIGLIEIYEVP